MTTAVRVAECQFCGGAGVMRATFEKPSGKRSKARVVFCPDCQGQGARLAGVSRADS